ncbi:hypothetical protein RUND412_010610 [Rhizina undulata]
MNTVPTEILHEILNHVPERDLGSLRLVNHFFNTAANDRYFRTIRVPFTNAAIETLKHLSHQPHVVRCVQHLIYPYRLDSSSVPSCMRVYRRPRSQDEGPQEVFDIVKFALSKMPNIREITTNLHGVKFEDDDGLPENSIMQPIDSNEHLHAEAFCELLAGLSQAQTRLDTLTIHSVWSGILRDEVNTVWKYAPLFQNLSSLTVFFCSDGSILDYERMQDDVNEGRIFKFLSSAPKLKKLSLGLDWENFNECGFIGRPRVAPFPKILGDNFVWERLEAFYFNHGYGSIHTEELMHFWARHSTTLKIFGLYIPRLGTGTWRELFDFIKEQPKICLENIIIIEPAEVSGDIRIKGYRCSDDGNNINVYTLHGGPPFPTVEAEFKEQALEEPEGYYEVEEVTNNLLLLDKVED